MTMIGCVAYSLDGCGDSRVNLPSGMALLRKYNKSPESELETPDAAMEQHVKVFEVCLLTNREEKKDDEVHYLKELHALCLRNLSLPDRPFIYNNLITKKDAAIINAEFGLAAFFDGFHELEEFILRRVELLLKKASTQDASVVVPMAFFSLPLPLCTPKDQRGMPDEFVPSLRITTPRGAAAGP